MRTQNEKRKKRIERISLRKPSNKYDGVDEDEEGDDDDDDEVNCGGGDEGSAGEESEHNNGEARGADGNDISAKHFLRVDENILRTSTKKALTSSAKPNLALHIQGPLPPSWQDERFRSKRILIQF